MSTDKQKEAPPALAVATGSASGALERVQAWLYKSTTSPYVDTKTGLSLDFDIQALIQEVLAYRKGGLTEEILRRGDGYIKVGRGCAIVAASSLPNVRDEPRHE